MRAEFFGTDDQRVVLRRGWAMPALLDRDLRYSHYGRTVGLVRPGDRDMDRLTNLATVQGHTNYDAVGSNKVEAVKAAIEARGLVPMHCGKWEGAASTLAAAWYVIATLSMPRDLSLLRVDTSHPDHRMASMAQMALGRGYLPVTGEVLRGLCRPAVCLLAVDRGANVVACASASVFAHAGHAGYGQQAW